MNLFNTFACWQTLFLEHAQVLYLKKYQMRKKKIRCVEFDLYLVKLKRYHLRYMGTCRQVITSKCNDIGQIIKIEITNNSNIWKALYRKERAANLFSFQYMYISHFDVRN